MEAHAAQLSAQAANPPKRPKIFDKDAPDKLFSEVPIDELVDFLIKNRFMVPKNLRTRLQETFSPRNMSGKAHEDEISLENELHKQVSLAQKVRESLIDDDGNVMRGRDVSAAMSSINSLISTANRIMKDIYTQKRVQLIETTTVEVLKELDPDIHQKFLDRFRERLME